MDALSGFVLSCGLDLRMGNGKFPGYNFDNKIGEFCIIISTGCCRDTKLLFTNCQKSVASSTISKIFYPSKKSQKNPEQCNTTATINMVAT
jgi:hypothetical protein